MSGLLPQHQQLIEASAISCEVAEARGYYSVTKPTELTRLFSASQRLAPGLVIPVFNVYGEREFCQLRPDEPRVKDGRTLKYETPAKVRMAIDCPPATLEHIGNPKVRLFVTEGVRKADALVSHGLPAIALLGVWNWRGTNPSGGKTVLPDWHGIALNGREIVICFDSDAFENVGVHAAVEQLGRWLEHRDAKLAFAYLPSGEHGAKVGADDFLAAGHSRDDLLARVVREWRPLPHATVTKRREMPDVPSRTLHETLAVFERWLHLPDTDAVVVVLGAIAANLMDGADPVWLLLIAPPSSGKSEILQATALLPYIHSAATLTEGALLSGVKRNEFADGARGGLLPAIGSFGLLMAKDFGSVLSMNHDTRTTLLAMLREVYDGEVTRHVGTSGGQTLHWKGKMGLIAGATAAYDQFAAVIASMGDRFLLCRMAGCDPDEQARIALDRDPEDGALMRRELGDAVAGLFRGELPKPTGLHAGEKARIRNLSVFVTHARSAVIRDGYKQEIQFVPDPEAPARFATAAAQLKSGLERIGAPHEQTWRIVRKVALDSMPTLRLRVIDALNATNDALSTNEVAKTCHHPANTIRRTLEDLTALRIAERAQPGESQDKRAHHWRLADDARERYAKAIEKCAPEKSVSESVGVVKSGHPVASNTNGVAPAEFSGANFEPRPPTCERHPNNEWRLTNSTHWVCGICHPPASSLQNIIWTEA